MNIAYCGYDFFHGCLRQLIHDGHHILKVYTIPSEKSPDSNQYIYEICQARQIPVTLTPPCASDLEALQRQGCELLITAAYPHKIPDLDAVGLKGINIHPSLLPQGRGIWPLPWIILKDLKRSGVSLHKLNAQWDAGDILLQHDFPIAAREDLESLSAKTQLHAQTLLTQVMSDLEAYWQGAVPQQGEASYWPFPEIKYRNLDWSSGVEQIDRVCRAFGKFGSYAYFEQQAWWVYDLTAWPQDHTYPIGSVAHKTNTEMIIAANDGLVSLRYFEVAPRLDDQIVS